MARVDEYTAGITDEAFKAWMAAVDRACSRLSGVSIFDLPDKAFWGWYDDGYTPTEMARMALEEEGWED